MSYYTYDYYRCVISPQYQSEAFVRQPQPHTDQLQLGLNSFSERVPPTNPPLSFCPPDVTMARDRRVWQTEPRPPEIVSQRNMKNHRRRKSHLDDVYGPNFEEFKDREYRKGRYKKWDQSDHRGSALRSIDRTPLRKIERGNRSERDKSSCSVKPSNYEKQSSVSIDNNKNKYNFKKDCDTKSKSSDVPERKDLTINTDISDKGYKEKKSNGKMKTSESETLECNVDSKVMKVNDKISEVIVNVPADVDKCLNSLPVPLSSTTDTVDIVDSNHCSVEAIEIEGNKETPHQIFVAPDNDGDSDQKCTTNVDQISREKEMESDEETVCCNDFISIDEIDTTKSFLDRLPVDDYRVMDMEVDCPSPGKRIRKESSNDQAEAQYKNLYPEINCDQLLNELNEAIEDKCKNMMNYVDKEETTSSEKILPIHPSTSNDASLPMKITKENSKTEKSHCKVEPLSKNSSDERMKDGKSSKEHAKRKLEKHRTDFERRSSHKRMSSLFYPGLANYTIPKLNSGKKFSDTDEPYMNKMQSLFGTDEDDEKNQKVAESTNNDDKDIPKKYHRKRLSADEQHSQNKKKCIDTKTSSSSKGFVERHTKPSSKLVEEKSKSNKNSRRNIHTSKTSTSTDTKRCKASKGSRDKSNPGEISTEAIRLSRAGNELKNPKEKFVNTVKKCESNNAKQATENDNAIEIKDPKKNIRMMDNKRRNSETEPSKTKLITDRRHSLQLNRPTEGNQSDKLLEKLQTKKILKKVDPANDVESPLTNNSDKSTEDQNEELICEQSTNPLPTEKPTSSKKSSATNSKLQTLNTTIKRKNSTTEFDEISSALLKMFESETTTLESSAEPVSCLEKETTSEVILEGTHSVLSKPSIESLEVISDGKAKCSSDFLPKIIEKKVSHDIATISDKLSSELSEIERNVSKCSNLEADLGSTKSPGEVGTSIDSSQKMPEDIDGLLSTSCQQLGSSSRISHSHNDESTSTEKPIEKVLNESYGIDHEPILKSIDDNKKKSSELKKPPSVKTAVTCELLSTSEKCYPLTGVSPQFHRVQSCMVYSDCSKKATITESGISICNDAKSISIEKPAKEVRDGSDEMDHKPIMESAEKKVIPSTLKIPLFIKTAVKSELLFTSEYCHPLAVTSLPQLRRIQSWVVYCDSNEKATVMESPDVKESVESIRVEQCSAVGGSNEVVETILDSDTLDDVIEIKPNIPVIDLTKESNDINITKPDSKADLLGLLEEEFNISGDRITIYRSDETSNNSLEVQAMSASITPANILRTNTSQGIGGDVDESTDIIAKVEPGLSIQHCVNQSNLNTESTEDTPSLAFAQNVRTLITQLEDSDSQSDVSAEISHSEEAVSQEKNTESVERPAAETVQPAIHNLSLESVIPVDSNGGVFTHPEPVHHAAPNSKKRNSRWNSQQNMQTLDETRTSPLHSTIQSEVQKENDSNNVVQPSELVHLGSPQRSAQENRLNGAQVMSQSPTLEIILPEQSPCRADINSNSTLPDSQNAGTAHNISNVYHHLTQKEYSLRNAMVPFINLMACIRKNQTDHVLNLKKTMCIEPELWKIELKLAEHVYMNKLKIYSGYIVNRLKSLNLLGNMDSVTGYETIELIFQSVRNVNKSFTKTSTILFLEHLMEPNDSFYKSVPYLKSFYSLVKIICVEITRRSQAKEVSPDLSSYQLAPNQRKILAHQIQLYQKTLDIEKNRLHSSSSHHGSERLTSENNNQPVSAAITLSSLLNSRPVQRNSSMNQVAERTATSKSYSMIEGQARYVTNVQGHAPIVFRSPAHRPEGSINSPAHAFNESNKNPLNSLVFNSPAHLPTDSRSPAHRSEVILPQVRSQRKTNISTIMPPPGTLRSPAHRPEELSTSSVMNNAAHMYSGYSSATLRSPVHRNEEMQPPGYFANTNHSITRQVHLSSIVRSPAHLPEALPSAYSSNVGGQSKTNNATLISAGHSPATVRSPVHRSVGSMNPPPPYSIPSTRNHMNNASLDALQSLSHNIPSYNMSTHSIPNIVNWAAFTKSPAHRPESFSASSSPGHFPAALGSLAQGSDRPMNSPSHSSTFTKSPIQQPGSRHEFVVPKQPAIKSRIVNSPPVTLSMNSSPSPSVDQNSPAHAPFPNVISMSPDQNSSNGASPRAPYVAFGSPHQTPTSATPSQTAMPNLINIRSRSPVYAPMLFSPPNYVQDETDDPLDVDVEDSQHNSGIEGTNEKVLETIDLTWLDEVDEEQIQKEIDFIVVKKEEPDDGEVILNREQFPVIASPSDSGIASPSLQDECSEHVYLDRLCICENPAEYLCKCRMVMYCSASCQTKDWKDHKIICQKYR